MIDNQNLTEADLLIAHEETFKTVESTDAELFTSDLTFEGTLTEADLLGADWDPTLAFYKEQVENGFTYPVADFTLAPLTDEDHAALDSITFEEIQEMTNQQNAAASQAL